ncbi:MAG TPA: hypothetical protein PLE30_04775 [Candidatus Kapabacteria bacterium]|nr:hypothetical protein [Candidatus Kapabacteria bacterium]
MLILFFVFNLFGGLLSFVILQKKHQKDVKREIINLLSDSELVTFIFPKDTKEQKKTGIVWIHSQEFRYKNKMYDIVRKSTIGDSIKYIVYYDKKETNLISAFINSFDSDESKKRNSRLSNLKLFKLDYIQDSFVKIEPTYKIIQYYNDFIINYSFLNIKIIFKPPCFI